MRDAEKDRLALSVADRHSEFEEALAGNRRKYPTREFQLLAEAVRRYVEKDRKRRDDAPQRCQCRSRARRLSPGRTKAGSQRSARRGRKDWNASSFSATIRTSTGLSSSGILPGGVLPQPSKSPRLWVGPRDYGHRLAPSLPPPRRTETQEPSRLPTERRP